MRKRLFEIIEKSRDGEFWSRIYDYVMIGVIALSLVPLAFLRETPLLRAIDRFAVTVFILDYLLRLATADYKLPQKSRWAFACYPFTPMALIDLLSILPSVSPINSGFRLLRLFRMFRAFRVFRALRALRYSKSIFIIAAVFKKQKTPLLAVGSLAFGYMMLSALLIFNVEPDSFENFFDAVYWAGISLTTVGYGDIYPVTAVGRFITMVSAFFGIAIVALPSSVITAGYMKEIQDRKKEL